MHEFSICQHLFQLIHQYAQQRRVHVSIGALAAIDQVALRFAFGPIQDTHQLLSVI